MIKEKEKEKEDGGEEGTLMLKRQLIILVLFLSFIPLEFGRMPVGEGTADVLVTGFFSCDRFGVPLNYYPIKTTAYFSVGLRNSASEPKNITLNISIRDVTHVPIGMGQLNTTISSNSTEHYIMGVFLPNWARLGLATADATVFVEGEFADGETTQFTIGPEDLIPPTVSILSPENMTYSESNIVPLVFTVNERPFWMSYYMNEHGNTTIEGNVTLTDLANGDYNLVVYVNDSSGNVGFSQVNFTVLVIHDVAVTNVQCSPTRVYTGQSVSISVSAQNEGTTSETFRVSVHANATLIGTLWVMNLSAGDDTILSYTWNTTDTSKGIYTIKATAHPVVDEVDITDNTMSYSSLLVTIMGDVDGDFDVDIFDIVLIASFYGVEYTDPRYNQFFDLNLDGEIDIFDIVIAADNYGQT